MAVKIKKKKYSILHSNRDNIRNISGLVFQATTDPHSTFLMGVKGFKNDKDKKRDLKKKETKKEQNNVIDFIDYLKRLRDK